MLTYRKAALFGLIPIIGVSGYFLWSFDKKPTAQMTALFVRQKELATDFAGTSGSLVSYVKNCISAPTAPGKAADLSRANRSYIVLTMNRFVSEGIDANEVANATAKVLDIYLKRSDTVPKTCDDIGVNLYEPEQTRIISLITENLDQIEAVKLRSAVNGVLQ